MELDLNLLWNHIARIDGNFTYFKERFLREVFPNFYTGIEFDIQIMNGVSYKNTVNNFLKPMVEMDQLILV